MSKRRSPCISFFLLLAALLGLVVICAIALVLSLPARVERTFGPPSSHIDFLQRSYLSGMLLLQENDLTLPHDPYGSERPFQVQLGESTSSIVNRLQEEGLIANAAAFRNYLHYSGLDTSLQAGEYKLSPSMTPLEIARAMQDATPTEISFRILPGWRLEEIDAALPTSGLNISPDAFHEAAHSRPAGYPFLQNLPSGASLEGFLFPDVYTLPRKLTADELIVILLNNFQAQVNDDLREGFSRQGLSLFEAVTLASIVEREAVVEDEMPLIASVFFNRRVAGLKLDSDPTVQYALGFNAKQGTWWKNPLALDDLKVVSPYNTYLVPGLPPGPIANPGLGALRAVAFPAKTPYYYFRAACDNSGRHIFAETFNEHIKNACP